MGWWETAYLNKASLSEQFTEEARASLPAFSSSAPQDVFAAVTLQRIRLRHDQQVPEWEGAPEGAGRASRPFAASTD